VAESSKVNTIWFKTPVLNACVSAAGLSFALSFAVLLKLAPTFRHPGCFPNSESWKFSTILRPEAVASMRC